MSSLLPHDLCHGRSTSLRPPTPRDGGAWWAAVYGVAQSRTRLKQLSSSSSSSSLAIKKNNNLESQGGDFHGSPVVKNLPCNTGHMGSIPGQKTKILHATEQLSLCATSRESVPRREGSCMTTKILHVATKISCSQRKDKYIASI